MDKLKAFLTKSGPFGVPVYAYVGGIIAIGLGFWYFKTHNTGNAAQAPQTNYPTVPGGPPLPYPDPGAGAAGGPPASAFTLPSAGSSVPQYSSQANFYSPPPQDTSSQQFAQAVQTPAPLNQNYDPAYASYVQPPTPPVRPTNTGSFMQNIVNTIANVPTTFQSFNPVKKRSSGTQAI